MWLIYFTVSSILFDKTILRSVSDRPVSLSAHLFLLSELLVLSSTSSHITIFLSASPTSSSSLYSVITLVFFPFAFHSVILLLLSFPHPAATFLPPDSHSSLLFISPYPLIYHPTCPCAPCSPPAPFHPAPILTFLFSYPCCFAAIFHFNLGTSSHLLESNKTSTAVKTDRTFEWKISISVVRLTWDVNLKTIRRTRGTQRWGRGIAAVPKITFKCKMERTKEDVCDLMRAVGGKTICWWYHDGLENVSHSHSYHHTVFPLDWRVWPSAASAIISWCPVFKCIQTRLNDVLI